MGLAHPPREIGNSHVCTHQQKGAIGNLTRIRELMITTLTEP